MGAVVVESCHPMFSMTMPSTTVSTHIQAAVRGRVRAATTTSTTRWARNMLGVHGQPRSPKMPAIGVSAIDIQNAPTGLTRVITTGTAGSSAVTMISIPDPSPERSATVRPRKTVISAASPTSACGVHPARARIPSDSSRVSARPVRIGGR